MSEVCVIMPIGTDPVVRDKRRILYNAASRHGLRITLPTTDEEIVAGRRRPDSTDFMRADLVVADLSYERPSCYYELGCAETLLKPVVIIAEKGTVVHQTQCGSGALFYTDLPGFERLIDTIFDRIVADDQWQLGSVS